MKFRIIRTLLIVCLAMTWGPASARDLKIVFSQYTPPYVFENGTGIVVDIVRAALEPAGYTVTPVYAPLSRAFKLFADSKVDGTTIIQQSSGLEAYYSDDFMRYHNRAFGLKTRNFKVRGTSDLKNKSVVGFQYAKKYLGQEFGRMAAENPKYNEMAQQEAQTRMLLLGRVDIVVMDESIFRYYRERLVTEGKADRAQEIDAFDIFPPTPYKAAFKYAKTRDDFNKGLAALRKNGQYDAIYQKYVEQHFAIAE